MTSHHFHIVWRSLNSSKYARNKRLHLSLNYDKIHLLMDLNSPLTLDSKLLLLLTTLDFLQCFQPKIFHGICNAVWYIPRVLSFLQFVIVKKKEWKNSSDSTRRFNLFKNIWEPSSNMPWNMVMIWDLKNTICVNNTRLNAYRIFYTDNFRKIVHNFTFDFLKNNYYSAITCKLKINMYFFIITCIIMKILIGVIATWSTNVPIL